VAFSGSVPETFGIVGLQKESVIIPFPSLMKYYTATDVLSTLHFAYGGAEKGLL